MKFVSFATLTTATLLVQHNTVALASLADEVPMQMSTLKIDTTRDPKVFQTPDARKGGYIYKDELYEKIQTEFDMQGFTMAMNFEVVGDSLMTVQDLADGQKEVDLTINNLKVDLDASILMQMHCDSNDHANSDEECQDLWDMHLVGGTEKVIVDQDGNILELITADGDVIPLMDEKEVMELKSKTQQHFDTHTQLYKMIPDHAVNPGDGWAGDIDMDELGNFRGQGTLLGYTTYENVDTAVFTFQGTLHLDLAKWADTLGLPSQMAGGGSPAVGAYDMEAEAPPMPTMEATEVSYLVLWDYTDHIARYLECNITTAFDIKNQQDGRYGASPDTHVPMNIVVAMSTDIVERSEGPDDAVVPPPATTTTTTEEDVKVVTAPETEDFKEVEEKVYKSKESLQTESESAKSKNGGAVVGILVFVAVAAVAAVGWKHRFQIEDRLLFRSNNSVQSRRADFTPISVEPSAYDFA